MKRRILLLITVATLSNPLYAVLTSTVPCLTKEISCESALTSCKASECFSGKQIGCPTKPMDCPKECPATRKQCKDTICPDGTFACEGEASLCAGQEYPLLSNPISFIKQEGSISHKDRIQIELIHLTQGSCIRLNTKRAQETISMTLERSFPGVSRPLYYGHKGVTIHGAERTSGSSNRIYYRIIDSSLEKPRHETFRVECDLNSCSEKITFACHRHRADGTIDAVNCSDAIAFDLTACETFEKCQNSLLTPPFTPSKYPEHRNHFVLTPGNLKRGQCIRIKARSQTSTIGLDLGDIQFETLETTQSTTLPRITITNKKAAPSAWGSHLAIHGMNPNTNEFTISGDKTSQTITCRHNCVLTLRCFDGSIQTDCNDIIHTDLVTCSPPQEEQHLTRTVPVKCETAGSSCPEVCKTCSEADDSVMCRSECITNCKTCPTYCPP